MRPLFVIALLGLLAESVGTIRPTTRSGAFDMKGEGTTPVACHGVSYMELGRPEAVSEDTAASRDPYFAKVRERIWKEWAWRIKGAQTRPIAVAFDILPNGSVAGIRLLRSGDPSVDLDATEAVRTAAPFDPLPTDCGTHTMSAIFAPIDCKVLTTDPGVIALRDQLRSDNVFLAVTRPRQLLPGSPELERINLLKKQFVSVAASRHGTMGLKKIEPTVEGDSVADYILVVDGHITVVEDYACDSYGPPGVVKDEIEHVELGFLAHENGSVFHSGAPVGRELVIEYQLPGRGMWWF